MLGKANLIRDNLLHSFPLLFASYTLFKFFNIHSLFTCSLTFIFRISILVIVIFVLFINIIINFIVVVFIVIFNLLQFLIYITTSFLVLFIVIEEYVVFEDDSFTVGFDESICPSCSLLLLPLLILFLLVRSGFSIVICEVDLFCEFNAKGTFLNPRCFRFQGNCLYRKLFKYRVVNTWDHIWRLNEWETKGWFHVNTSIETWELELRIREEIAQTLLLREDIQLNILLLINKSNCIFVIVLICPFQVFFGLLSMSKNLVQYVSNDPNLRSILFRYSINDII